MGIYQPMANANRNRRSRFDARHTLAAIILVLLPLLALGGALMPGMVEIAEEEDTSAAVAQPDFVPLKVKRRPLLIPRDFSTGFVPELVNFDHLSGTTDPGELFIAEMAQMAFGGGHGELIILDDIEEFVRNVLFKDALEPEALDDLPGGPFDESLFALIPNPIGVDTGYQFDDFAGSPSPTTPVPEPGTAVLALLGLAGLGWYRRRSERA